VADTVAVDQGGDPTRGGELTLQGVGSDETKEGSAGRPVALADEGGEGAASHLAEVSPGAEATRAPRPGAGRKEAALVFAIMAGLAVAAFHSAWAQPFSAQVGPGGDAEEYAWFLGWLPYAIGHGLDPLVSTYVNAPHGVNLMWNTSALLPSFLMSPVTVLAGAAFSYNLLMTAGLALTGLFSYLAFRRWTTEVPSLAGALVVGFSPYMFTEANGHLAQVLLMSAPLFLILGDRLLVRQSSRPWKDGLLLGLLAWAQLLTGEEILVMEAIAALVGVVALASLAEREVLGKLPYALKGLGVGVGTFTVLSAPFLAVQFLGPDRVQNPHPPNIFVSDLFNFFVPTSVTKLAPAEALKVSSQFTGNLSEQAAYIGLPLLAFSAIALVLARRRRVTWVAASIAVVCAILSLGPTLHYNGRVTSHNLPDYWLDKLPFFKNLLADRFASMVSIGIGLLVALGAEELRRRKAVLQVPGWALVGLGLAAIFPTTNFPAAGSPRYLAFETGQSCPGRPPGAPPPTALVVPSVNEMDLRWQEEAHFCFKMPSATGMTGTNSADLGFQGVLLNLGQPGQPLLPTTPAERALAGRELSRMHIEEIVVGPEWPAVPAWTPQGQAEAVSWVTWLVGRAPEQSKDPYIAYIWKDLPPASDIASGHVPPM
jgi:hypothetical protein